jgi:beta-glucosidase
MLATMNSTDKLAVVHGYFGLWIGYVDALPDVGFPSLRLEDGPQGVADGVVQVTAWPSAMTVIMSWDTDAMYAFGAAMGAEEFAKGANVHLAPAVNLGRVPWSGRQFEYAGEDPVLAAAYARQAVQGIQSNGISACIKHFTDNVSTRAWLAGGCGMQRSLGHLVPRHNSITEAIPLPAFLGLSPRRLFRRKSTIACQ